MERCNRPADLYPLSAYVQCVWRRPRLCAQEAPEAQRSAGGLAHAASAYAAHATLRSCSSSPLSTDCVAVAFVSGRLSSPS